MTDQEKIKRLEDAVQKAKRAIDCASELLTGEERDDEFDRLEREFDLAEVRIYA